MGCRIIRFNKNIEKEIIRAAEDAASILKAGGIVIHPTDTCYGVAADIRKPEAIAKVYKFKNRESNKPLFIIVQDFDEFSKYGEWHREIGQMINSNPEDMYTFVVKRKNELPQYVNAGIETVGIQIPKIRISLELISATGSPLIGTSANLSGQENNYSIEKLLEQIKHSDIFPDLILDGGDLPVKKPSSVVSYENGNIKVLR